MVNLLLWAAPPGSLDPPAGASLTYQLLQVTTCFSFVYTWSHENGKIFVRKFTKERLSTMLVMPKSLGENLRTARRRKAWAQDELAERAGVGVTTIVRIERGQIKDPHVSTLRKLAAALGISPEQLLEED